MGEESSELARFKGLVADFSILDRLSWEECQQLEPLCRWAGRLVWRGELVPIIAPVGTRRDHQAYDAAVCQAGLKVFARPVMPGEDPWPGVAAADVAIEEAPLVVCEELEPGLRKRTLDGPRRGVAIDRDPPSP